MYSINGDFGKVRHIPIPFGYPIQPEQKSPAPFNFSSGGWHHCNDQYHIHRTNGSSQQHLLLFSLSDGGRMQINNGTVINLPASSAAWIPPECEHSYYTAPGEQWEFYWVHLFDSPALDLQGIFASSYCLPLSRMEVIRQEFEGLLHNKHKNLREFQIESSRRFSNIYHLLLEKNTYTSTVKSNDSLVLDIIQNMETDCSRDWDLPYLSATYYISVPQLIRRFKAETGLTPHACLMFIRLQSAEMYLKYTSLSIDHISKQTGFPSTSNFIMQFKKCYGYTPKKYRECR